MTLSIRLSEEEKNLFKHMAKFNNMSVSEFVRNAVLEKIEDEYDLKEALLAKAEYDANPVGYTLDEIEKELGL